MNIYEKIKLLLRRDIILCIVMSIFVVIAYSGIIKNDFIGYDDDKYVIKNIHVQQGISKDSILWAFTSLHASNWHPVTWLSHMLDVELYGMNAGGHHFSSLLLHLANSLLLFFVLKNMTGAPLRSCAAALLFAIHPLHVESVAWVAERKDVLSTFFWLLTTWSYIRYVTTKKRYDYLLAVLFFLLALMAKPMAVTLPFSLLLIDYWPLHRVQHISQDNSSYSKNIFVRYLPMIYEKTPFFLLSAISSSLTYFAQKHGDAVAGLEEYPLSIRIANALISYATYIQKAVLPHDLGILYPYPSAISVWQAAGAAFVLSGITLLAARHRERFQWLAVGWLWYLGTLVPVIGLVQVGVQAFADRYTYIPLIGIFIIASWGADELLRNFRHKKIALSAAAATIFSALIINTRIQASYWRDSVTLFEHTLQVTEGNYIIHNNLGFEFALQGQYEKALAQYQEALRIHRNFEQAAVNYGSALFSSGKKEESFAYYEEILNSRPSFANVHYNFGTLLLKDGRYDKAAFHFQAALRLKPNFAAACNGLGAVMLYKGNIEQAVMLFRKSLEMNPEFPDAKMNLKSVSDHLRQAGAQQNINLDLDTEQKEK
ncbi:MAG: tetratricopeptide repeat protein [Candidatus Electronema sp. VV]